MGEAPAAGLSVESTVCNVRVVGQFSVRRASASPPLAGAAPGPLPWRCLWVVRISSSSTAALYGGLWGAVWLPLERFSSGGRRHRPSSRPCPSDFLIPLAPSTLKTEDWTLLNCLF